MRRLPCGISVLEGLWQHLHAAQRHGWCMNGWLNDGAAVLQAAAAAIEKEEAVDRIEGSLLRPDIDDPDRCRPGIRSCLSGAERAAICLQLALLGV